MTDVAEIVATGTGLGEGPVYCPDDTVVFTCLSLGLLHRAHLDSGQLEVLADTAGSPNAAVAASDGGFLVTQNGGFDLATMLAPDRPPPPGFPPFRGEIGEYRPVEPGIQRIHPDGRVDYLVRGSCQSPNDLVVAADGTLYFTDPPHSHAKRDAHVARVQVVHPDGTFEIYADGFSYCNGIALEADGTVVVVEADGLQRVYADGSREWIVEHLGPGRGDGLCIDVDGRFYVAARQENGIRVVEDGREVDFLPGPGEGVVTNCCFGGVDGRTLFATEGFNGWLLAWPNMPTPGLAQHAWRTR
jgi:gluconolactonase